MDQKELDVIVAEHGEWLNDRSKGKRAELRYSETMYNVNLQDARFQMAKLSGINLLSSNLSNASFWCADLRCTRFRFTKLWHTDLTEAHLLYTDFSGADLYKTKLKCKLLSTRFSFVPIIGTKDYTGSIKFGMINQVLEHVYMCNTGE